MSSVKKMNGTSKENRKTVNEGDTKNNIFHLIQRSSYLLCVYMSFLIHQADL